MDNFSIVYKGFIEIVQNYSPLFSIRNFQAFRD